MPLRRLSSSRESVGGMSRQITLYTPGSRAEDGGNVPPTPFCTSWASIRSLRGEELDRADLIAEAVELTVRIPYQIGIASNMLVGFELEMWKITHIEDQDRMHIFLDLFCAEIGQNAGQQS
jgi:SPP1 family predicted phage head-tail adaptor